MIEFRYIPKKLSVTCILYFLSIIIVSIVNASSGSSNSLFDYVSNFRDGGSASLLVLTIGILPTLSIVIPLVLDQMENEMIVLRIKDKRKLLKVHFTFIILVSVFFTSVIVLGGIIGSFIATGDIQNLWGNKEGMLYFLLDDKDYFQLYVPHVTTAKVWGYIITSRFLAIFFIATLVTFLKIILNKNSYVFFLSIILLGTDVLFSERFSLFLGRARITMETWITIEDQWFNLGYLMFLIIVLYILCKKLYDRKEFY